MASCDDDVASFYEEDVEIDIPYAPIPGKIVGYLVDKKDLDEAQAWARTWKAAAKRNRRVLRMTRKYVTELKLLRKDDVAALEDERDRLRRELEAARSALQAAPEAHLIDCFVGGKLGECVPGCPARLRREALAERLKAKG